jgi:hypothetical protein
MSSYCRDIVSICPKDRFPEIFLEQFSVLFSEKSCCDTLDDLNHTLWRYHRNSLQKEVHMIEIYSNLMEYDVIGLFLDFMEAYISNRLIKNLMLEYLSPVLYRAYEMIQK